MLIKEIYELRVERLNLKSLCARLLLGVGLVLFSTGVFASTTTGTLTVTANVNNVCKLTSGTLAFGAYDPVNTNATTPLAQTATFTMKCTKGTSATMLMGQGSNPGTGSTDSAPIRNMLNGTTQLNYQLYSDAGDTTVWNNSTGINHTATGQSETLNVYGSIPAGQNVGSGSYTDTVVITVNY